MQGEETRIRISFTSWLLIATGLHMAHGMEITSDGAFGSLPDLCQIFARSLPDLCLWGSHVAEIKDGGISIHNTKSQIPGWSFASI